MEKQILFRASGIGALMVEGRGTTLTDLQKRTLQEYKDRAAGIGKPLTPKQTEDMYVLIAKENAPPELSDTAKSFIEDTWLLNEKGFHEELRNKYITKGNINEDDGIVLLSEVENNFYTKNIERITIGNITGECDIKTTKDGITIIKDIKSSWSPKTFMKSDLSKIYEWQGRVYMYLYDADEFHLHYTLTDTPPHLVEKAKQAEYYRYYYNGMTDEELENLELSLVPVYEQIDRNMTFTTGNYTKEERVKTFKILRDKDKEAALLAKIPMALEYYNSLTLNKI